MAKLPIYDRTGKKVGTYEIDPAAVSSKINRKLLHEVVVMYQANRRQGTHQTKSRGQVSGSTKKMYRQKGTGNARAGSKRTNIRRGGGHAFALQRRNYAFRLPKKALRAATRMAIAGKLQDDQVVVIDQLQIAQPRTREIADMLKALQLEGTSTLIAVDSHSPEVYRSARNIPFVSVSPVRELNAFSVLRPQRLLFTKAALDAIKNQALTN